jgi:polyisoprenoid-binding protein YceI
MKKLTLVILLLLTVSVAFAQYKPVDQGSSLQFTIKNFGFDVTGTFTGFKGDIKFDPQKPAESNFDVMIDANTVNTDNGLRDNHLRDNSYFDVKNYPNIHFVSTKVTSKSGGFVITGKLTIKKVVKEISFPFAATPSGDGYLFKGTFKINRRDFDVGGTSTISDNLEVALNVLAKKV